MRPFPKQRKYKTFKAALECSIRKWEYFSVCTRPELEKNDSKVRGFCGLCYFNGVNKNNLCSYSAEYEFVDNCYLCCDADDNTGNMKQFHAASRKVLKALKRLRGE